MNKALKIAVVFLVIGLTACKGETYCVLKPHYCTFIVTNTLSEEVSITGVERLYRRPFELILSSGESYSYIQDIMEGGMVEKDKFPLYMASTIRFESQTYGTCEFDSPERLGVYHEQWQGDLDCTTLVIDESLFRVQ